MKVQQVKMIYTLSNQRGEPCPSCGGAYRLKTNTIEIRDDLRSSQKIGVLFHEFFHYLIELCFPLKQFCKVAREAEFDYGSHEDYDDWCSWVCFFNSRLNKIWDILWRSYAETLLASEGS